MVCFCDGSLVLKVQLGPKHFSKTFVVIQDSSECFLFQGEIPPPVLSLINYIAKVVNPYKNI